MGKRETALQVAVDRTSLTEAAIIIREANESADIIEIGTSFFKDYGLLALRELRQVSNKKILADIKTVDEAAYEFEQIYQNGADIATVLGTSAIETLEICQKKAKKHQREFMIDTIGMTEEHYRHLSRVPEGIVCLHLSKDSLGDVTEYVRQTKKRYSLTHRLAVAGGVTLTDIPALKAEGVEIIIVGSGITKSGNIKEAARKFKEAIK